MTNYMQDKQTKENESNANQNTGYKISLIALSTQGSELYPPKSHLSVSCKPPIHVLITFDS